jgi:DNA modification methylase
MSVLKLINKRKANTFSDMHNIGKLKLKDCKNAVFRGDCLDWLDSIPNDSLDMIYIDPPFFTRTTYEKIWGNGWEIAAWEDWKDSTKGDIDSFIQYMEFRIQKMKEKLKDTGTFWLHCDYRANYKFRTMLEEVFGGNFVGEIANQTTNSGRDQVLTIGKGHETILIFSKKKEDFYFNNKYHVEQMPKSYKYEDERGIFASDNLTQDGKGTSKIFKDKELQPPNGKHWIWNQKRINQAIANEANKNEMDLTKDFIFFTSNGVPRVKRYWKGKKISTLTSLWTDCIKNSWTEDSISYPTKKSISLLKRIVECGCPENGIIGDFFAGGGTALLAAAKLGRCYIGCDVSPIAIKAQSRRFKEADLPLPTVYGFPKSKKSYLKMDGKEFEKFLSELCGWTHLNDKSGQGKGFDAIVPKENIGVQIKNQSQSLSVGDLRSVYGALESSTYDSALVVAWDISPSAQSELNKLKTKKNLNFSRLEDFLGCFLISEEKEAQIDSLLAKATKLEEKKAA